MISEKLILKHHKILITGASSGIGKTLAIKLSSLGANVFITGRSSDRLDETYFNLSGTGHAQEIFDFKDCDGSYNWIMEFSKKYGPFNGLFHSAGLEQIKPIRSVKQNDIDNILGGSLMSAFGLIRGCFNDKVMQRDSSIVLMSSVASMRGIPGMSVYSVTKAGINALTRTASRELAVKKIRVNAILAGEVKTEMHDRIMSNISDDGLNQIRQQHPLGFGEPDDVNNLAVFLLSKNSRWISGSLIAADGGYLS